MHQTDNRRSGSLLVISTRRQWPVRRTSCGRPDQEMELPDTTVIAVVDDDESVREAVVSLVKSLGYDAVAFSRAEDFLRSDQRGDFGCLIADVQMPRMTGSRPPCSAGRDRRSHSHHFDYRFSGSSGAGARASSRSEVLPDKALPRRGPPWMHTIRARFGLRMRPAAISRWRLRKRAYLEIALGPVQRHYHRRACRLRRDPGIASETSTWRRWSLRSQAPVGRRRAHPLPWTTSCWRRRRTIRSARFSGRGPFSAGCARSPRP